MTTSTAIRIPPWVRYGLIALGLPNLLVGVWAILSPQGFFDGFPGIDPRLVAAEPPFNAHLVTDAGSGFLASGVVLLVAASMFDTRSIRLAIVAFVAFAAPHASYHLSNPADALTTAENFLSTGRLIFSVVAAGVLYYFAAPRHGRTTTSS